MDFSGQWNSFDILNKIYWWFRFRLLQEGKKSFFLYISKTIKNIILWKISSHIYTCFPVPSSTIIQTHTHIFTQPQWEVDHSSVCACVWEGASSSSWILYWNYRSTTGSFVLLRPPTNIIHYHDYQILLHPEQIKLR